jgi:hypothetical protein
MTATSAPKHAPKGVASTSTSAKARPPSLAEEVSVIDEARGALAARDPGAALRALDEHDRRFPRGVLVPEARVLRVEALVLRGDRAAATKLAQPILAHDPKGQYAERLRSLLKGDLPD